MLKKIYNIFIAVLLCLMVSSCMGGKRPSHHIEHSSNDVITHSVNVQNKQSADIEVTSIVQSLELPNSELECEQIIVHTGYTVSYNSIFRLPNWVAYELTSSEVMGTIPRTNKFLPDPFAIGVQADNDDYKYTGWDRGHMCPAGDMKWSKQAMDESFYFTNICPQNPNLNGGDWKDLEEKCRDLVLLYGKIYIACGAIVGKAINGTIGSHEIVVPDAFFKVMLIDTNNGFESIGFYFENKAGSHNLSYYAMTVDEIEKYTNIDFFAALSDNIETEIESKYNIKVWQIN